jgi:hypothetical protein
MTVQAEEKIEALLSAREAKDRLARAVAEKANEYGRARAAEAADKKRLIDQLREPSGVSDDEAMKRVGGIVERAISNGLGEVLVYRFPNLLCTDNGRAISQAEGDWEQTLTGVPAEIYSFWHRKLRPLGYTLRVEIVEWPRGMPGDVGMMLRWS